MKKILLCLGATTWIVGSAGAQNSLPSPREYRQGVAIQRVANHNWVGYEHLVARLPIGAYLGTEDARYLSAMASLYSQKSSQEDILEAFLAEHPGSIDYNRARLWLAIYEYEHSEDVDLAASLVDIEPEGLVRSEYELYHLLYGYLLMTRRGGESHIAQATDHLRRVATSSSQWGDMATLYLSAIDWQRGDIPSAERKLESRQWSPEILPEVEYQATLMACSSDKPQQAIVQIQDLIRRYPQMADRAELRGALGRAYYATGDYQGAIKVLANKYKDYDTLPPAEAYALGASYYHLQRWSEAIGPLQFASTATDVSAPLAQFALGNIYRYQGDLAKAKLALSSAASNPLIPSALKEQTLYQLVEVGFASGSDAFGEQLRQTELFLKDYPKSQYRTRVIELLSQYLSASRDYAGSISLLTRLEQSGERLAPLRQDILVRWANSLGASSDGYLTHLGEAIRLGSQSEAYGIALTMRSAERLRRGDYRGAEGDARTALETSTGKRYEGGIANYLLGYALYNQRRYSDAAAPLNSFVRGGAPDEQRADALVRLGDIQLASSGKSAEAVNLYSRAHELSPSGSDEALYRIAGVQGLRGQYSEQISTIERIERDYPQSVYLARLTYDKGRAQMLGGNAKAAEATFASVEARYPASEVAPLSAIERALIHSNAGHEEDAIAAYKRVVELYPTSKAAQTAIADLRSLYSERKELDKYAAYVATLSGDLRPSTDDAAHLAFITIESRVGRGEQVADELEGYIKKYPTGADRGRAERLLVDQYVASGQTDRAVALLTSSAKSAKGAANELPLRLRLAQLLEDSAKYTEAHEAYTRAYALAKGASRESLSAGIGLVRTAYLAGQYTQATEVATELLGRKDLESEARWEVILLRAKAEEGNKALKTAAATYALLSDATDSPAGAEAMVRRGDVLLRLGQVAEAKKALTDFVASGTSQQYWLARGFVLLADCHDRAGERYLAQQYIESLRDNYKGTEADIQEMIQTRLTKYAN